MPFSQPIDIATIPGPYCEFRELFDKGKANYLPEYKPYNHKIPITEGSIPLFRPIYSLSKPELKTLRGYIDNNLKNGFIKLSTSLAGALILFIKKKDGSLRLYVDY